ncbi:hypothetical protein SISNIDRAFT_533769 [Sistotremastrum niveocremeum HHB9708]|uniref:Uncharacterized protein n=1 Tax=Sistotremastrum niveocremeum HHB9708 TaxID=1314777 RepID=A0A164YBX8_9AGAM|nr:hypothetical protein SISNIDRAFT_533769 [Sistotremastrum niveocremeum HHB9708]
MVPPADTIVGPGTQVIVMGSAESHFGVLYNSSAQSSLTTYPPNPANATTLCQVLFDYPLPNSDYIITIGHPYNSSLPIAIDFIGFKSTDGGEASNNTQPDEWIPVNLSQLKRIPPSGPQFSKSGASHGKPHPTSPEIAGLVLGVVSLIIGLGLVFFYFLRRRARRRAQNPTEDKPTSSNETARGVRSLTRDSGFFTQTTDSMEKQPSRGDRGGHVATLSDQYGYERNASHGGDTAIDITGMLLKNLVSQGCLVCLMILIQDPEPIQAFCLPQEAMRILALSKGRASVQGLTRWTVWISLKLNFQIHDGSAYLIPSLYLNLQIEMGTQVIPSI